MSWYIAIRGDAEHSLFADVPPLVDFLNTLPTLYQFGRREFHAAAGQPWVDVTLIRCNSKGNYATIGLSASKINLVELICSYEGDPNWYEQLATQIAQFLGWSAFEDSEDRLIWAPAEQPKAPESMRNAVTFSLPLNDVLSGPTPPLLNRRDADGSL